MMFSIITTQAIGGTREHKFNSAAELARWVWDNCPYMFASLKKDEQRD